MRAGLMKDVSANSIMAGKVNLWVSGGLGGFGYVSVPHKGRSSFNGSINGDSYGFKLERKYVRLRKFRWY
jgi:hypothetical protein